MQLFAQHVGEIAAITASCLWAFGALLFGLAGRRVGSLATNQIRLFLALVVLVTLHLLLRGRPLPAGLDGRQYCFLSLSGLAGLALGDYFYFQCLVVLGPRLGTLLMTAAPAFAAGLGFACLGEALGPHALAGMATSTLGVMMVIAGRRDSGWPSDASQRTRLLAYGAGLLGSLGQAGGMVLAKLGMRDAHGVLVVDAFSATVLRMVAGAGSTLLVAALLGQAPAMLRATRDGRAMRLLALAVVVGPTIGVWLSQVAVRETKAAIAQMLLSLVPIFMLPIARLAYGARLGRAAVLGTLLAVGGAVLLLWPAA
jgi:drug/metabolite transporter (DMT)-like permease